MSEHKINSVDYWDKRFQTNWEDYLGREQTVFFLQMLLENLPSQILGEISENKYSICDAGCAEGDGTQVLAQRFPKSEVLGIDFSIEAINKAKEYYPNVKYAQGDIMNLSKSFDIVICSNVLEHFSNPFDIIPLLINKTNSHLIIMVPFLEDERIKEHMYTFEYESFPLEINNYQLSYFKEIDCKLIEGTHWYGKQALIIYSNKELVDSSQFNLGVYNERKEYYEKEYFKQITQIESLNNDIQEKNQSIEWYHNKLEEKDQSINWHQNKIDDKDIIIRSLTNSLVENEAVIKYLMNENEQFKYKLTDSEQRITYNNEVIYDLNHQLANMRKTKAWRILNKYYKLMNSIKNIKVHGKKFLYISKTKGIKEAVKRSVKYLNSNETMNNFNNSPKLIEIYSKLVDEFKEGKIKGIAIIPSAFEFDELYNQRTINLAKYLAKEGYAVVYVAWQWNKNDELTKNYECFLNQIYQVPLFDFLETDFSSICSISDKKFIITFPAEEFNKLVVPFRENSFDIVYDIMDEWEEFYNTGESPWYKKEIEETIILNSDVIFAVSEPLKDKFKYLREDIMVIGNGYDEKVSKSRNISLKVAAEDKRIHMGYFGHLTTAWFDWDLVFDVAKNKNMFIHIIGYGADEKILEKITTFNNIKYYGKVHPGELHGIVKEWHVGIIPFKKSNLATAVDPIKIYEYLFFGLPTISTGIPHIGNYPLTTHCEDAKDVINTLEKTYLDILNNTLDLSEIEDFLAGTTWESRFTSMLKEIENADFLQALFEGEKR